MQTFRIICKKDIARILKSIRQENNLTQQQLANLFYVDVRQIRRYESIGTSSIEIINLYAKVFNTSTINILSMA